MSDPLETVHLKIPYLAAAQAQKHVTHNEALRMLDTLVQLSVIDASLTAPPGSPAEGDRYIVAATATGAWAGEEDNVAVYVDGGWQFLTPDVGWLAYDEATATLFVRQAGGWEPASAYFASVTQLGVNATADETNRLSVRSDAVLFSNIDAASGGTGDVRFVVNKEAVADAASLLFQTGFSGRAEVGLVGDDDFVFKVSPDGSAWTEAIRLDKDTGLPTILYDNATSGLTATNVQDAIDEVAAVGGGGAVDSVFGRTGAVAAAASDYDASQVDNDSGVAGATVAAALDALDGAVGGKQDSDGDLTAIAGLTPTNDDIVQRKAGAWTNRTPAQLKADLSLTKGDVGLGNVDNTADADKPVSAAQQTALDGKLATSAFDTEEPGPASGDFLYGKTAEGDLRKFDVGNLPGGGGGINNVVEDASPQLGGQLDVNGNPIGDGTRELISFVEDPAAVNQVEIENQATGAGPIVRAAGDDADIDLNLAGKGTGVVNAGGARVLTTADEGAGNGLDADTLDGNEASAFATAGHDHDGAYQPLDGELTALAGLASAADKAPYFTGSGTAALADFTAYGRSLAAVANEAALKALVNLEIGTDVQAYDGDLAAIAGLTPSNDDVVQRKAGAWTNRTMAELKVDLSLSASDVGLGGVTNDAQLKIASNLADLNNVATARVNLGVAIGSDVQAYDADTLKGDVENQSLTGGATVTVKNLGNLSGQTITPDPGDRAIQKITNNGAGTIAPHGSNTGCYLLVVKNASGAGAITTSGWDDVSGDSFDTTTTSEFLCHCTVVGDFSSMTIRKVT